MKAHRLTRESLTRDGAIGAVLTQDVRDHHGRIALAKGSPLSADSIAHLLTLDWDELHAIRLDADDVHEAEAGVRLVRAAAGREVKVGAMTAGHWPLCAATRGVVHVNVAALREINALDGIALYSLFDGQVVDENETVARGKIIPFAISDAALQRVESLARMHGGVVHIRRFVPWTVGVVIQESLGERATQRAQAVLAEKLAWFGSALLTPRVVSPTADDIEVALRAHLDAGARLLIVAGSRAMDPLDPVFQALATLGARFERRGVPAHPGSLLWIARLGAGEDEVPIIGLPSCGLFSQASVFDLLLPRILSGEHLTND
ncbi:MAG: hypothetical protein AB1762_19245, partial [Gemmatimonadota bacterium]